MIPDVSDTIVAIGTAPGGAARGMIRVSGPQTIACVARCFQPFLDDAKFAEVAFAQLIEGTLLIDGVRLLPCDLFVWPNEQSYTRQPTAELHTFGSPPLLERAVAALCRHGARLAEPGEFTLRAFLAGRLDLTQAEAVLGVVDATDPESLQTALGQLAGGLSRPLSELREQLLQLLAHLEAGLDFVEEDISFVSMAEIEGQLTAALELVRATLDQLVCRGQPSILPKVVLIGRPNAGKSTLFNALVDRYGVADSAVQALVSQHAGTTRDYLAAAVRYQGLSFELVDTAGVDPFADETSIAGMAQGMTSSQHRQADCSVMCEDPMEFNGCPIRHEDQSLTVVTKIDLIPTAPGPLFDTEVITCSSCAGTGLDVLAAAICEKLMQKNTATSAVASTAVRCTESLLHAQESLQVACELVREGGGDELIAAEIRAALQELGRVVGAVYTDDVLDRIFSQFCIGK